MAARYCIARSTNAGSCFFAPKALGNGDAVADRHLGREIAREKQRFARPRAQRDARLAVDRVELVQQRGGDRPVGFKDLQAIVEVQLGAIDGGQVHAHLLGGVDALRELQALDPGAHLLRPHFQVLRWCGAFRGKAEGGRHGRVVEVTFTNRSIDER